MLFGEAKCANLGRPNVSILGVANVLRPSELPPLFGRERGFSLKKCLKITYFGGKIFGSSDF